MKKFCRFFLSILLSGLLFLLSAIPSIAATTDSLFEIVENACDLIYDTRLEYMETESQTFIADDACFPVATIAVYTFHNIDGEYIEGFGNKDYFGSYSTYKIAADIFEKRAKQLFSNVSIKQLREDGRYFDAAKNAYVFNVRNYSGGWGAVDTCALVGYKEKNGIFAFYGYLGSGYIPDEYLDDVKNLKNFNDTIKIDDFEAVLTSNEEYLYISKRFKTTISYENNIIKFLSWEIVDSIPSVEDLVTIHSILDNSSTQNSSSTSGYITSSTAQMQPSTSKPTSVSNPSNITQSRPNSSSQTNTSTVFSETQSQSPSSEQTNTSNSSNTTQSKPNSSSQANTSTISSEIQSQSSSLEYTQVTTTSNTEINDVSNSVDSEIEKIDNENKKHNNKLWIIIGGIAILVAIGIVTTIITIKRKDDI